MRVLVLEDDPEWADYTRSCLEAEGWNCVVTVNITDAVAALNALHGFDAIVLDRHIEATGEDGLDLIGHLDNLGISIPRIVTSLWGSSEQRVEGIDAGADDYLAKPYAGAELVARLRRRVNRQSVRPYEGVMVVGPLELRPQLAVATWRGARIELSGQSFSFLAALAETPGVAVTSLDLWTKVWPHEKPPVRDILVQQAVKNLRTRIRAVGDASMIVAVPGIGYMLDVAAFPK